jgi:uncharacterized protein (TIGR03086 family)
MPTDLVELYRQASAWTAGKIPAAAQQLDAPTTCEPWSVRDLLNHMLATQQFFLGAATGEEHPLPGPNPPPLISDDPAHDFAECREAMLAAYGEPGVLERTGPSLGIAASDQLLHGWDVARSTDQDAKMPEGLPEAAYDVIHGRFTEEQRKGVFKPERQVATDASPQDRLLAYTGRTP